MTPPAKSLRERMSDDVEDTLAGLEARLRALQADLDLAAAPPPPRQEPPAETHRRSTAEAPPPARGEGARGGGAPATDPLEAFGAELRTLATELVSAWDRVVAAERGRGSHRILLEARADLRGLAALERALADAPAVRTLDLRAYAAGHASLVVEVS